MKKLFYGQTVDFYQVLNTKKSVSVFIPQMFPWENNEKTEIIINKDFRIMAAKNSKLLIKTGKGIREIDIPFSDMKHKKLCDLKTVLKDNNISFEEADGIYCDRTVWNQGDSTEKVCYCEKGMLSMCCGPYWGSQYVFYFADKRIRPTAGERTVKIIRFSYCNENVWQQAEDWFMYLMNKKRIIEFNDLCHIGDELNSRRKTANACRMYIKDESGAFNWYDLSSLF